MKIKVNKGKIKNPRWFQEAAAQEQIKQFAGDANEEINIEQQKKHMHSHWLLRFRHSAPVFLCKRRNMMMGIIDFGVIVIYRWRNICFCVVVSSKKRKNKTFCSLSLWPLFLEFVFSSKKWRQNANCNGKSAERGEESLLCRRYALGPHDYDAPLSLSPTLITSIDRELICLVKILPNARAMLSI